MTIRRFGLMLLACLTLSGPAGAYSIMARWGTQEVPYYINPVNSFMPEADAIVAIQNGASAWSMQSGANVLPYYMGRTSGTSVMNNGKNEIFFRNGSNGNYYGETYWWYDASGELVDADIIFYSSYTFFAGASGCAWGLYLEDAAAHEFGHVLGLGHSDVDGATMYPSMPYCSTAPRMLDPDDLNGIEALYPVASSNTPPAVVVASPSDQASGIEGQPLVFSGSASDREDGDLGEHLVWRSSRDGEIGTGTSFQRVLTVGTHTITAAVVDSTGASAESHHTVTIEAPVVAHADEITLTATRYRVRRARKADLTWTGSSASSIDVFRNGGRVATVTNLGMYTDVITGRERATYVYRVCEAGTTTCSNQITVRFRLRRR